MSFRTALTHYVDLNTPPSQNILKQMAFFTPDSEEQAKLKELAEVCHCNFELFSTIIHGCQYSGMKNMEM